MMADEKAVRLGLGHWPTPCHRIWDPVEARFEKCFLPIIPTIPTGVAVCILLSTTIAPLFKYHQPTWTKPFVEELVDRPHELLTGVKKHWPSSTIALLVISVLGLFAQCVAMFFTSSRIITVLTITSWVVASALVVISRPKTTPVSLLALYSSLLVSHSISFIENHPALRHDSIATILGALAALLAIGIILHMPMRDPDLPDDRISQVFEAPDPRLRSPEDNLTLWQWMSVSWMEPLISLGAKRQLNDQDVWQLGYEFQHKRLHDKFRELRGTVLRRVLEANKIDLVLVSFLGLVELFANYSTPVLLQQLLRSMEDVHAPRRAAVIYAVLSLVARLIAGQTAVFSLWYSRRCFERSRGEMIMMLYEKMLMRKVVGLEENRPDTDSESATGRPPEHPGGTNEKREQEKQSASMGKVLNLMRGDVYEVAQRFWECSSLTTKPLGLIFSAIFIWRLIGWPCFLGVVTVFVAQALNVLIARVLLMWERRRRGATDIKLQLISQFVEAIRHLRWYGWQDTWLRRIMEARQHELNLRVVTSMWSILIGLTNTFANGMFPVAAFYAYTYLAGQPLRIDIIFPALQLFSMLEDNLRNIPGLITALLNAYIAVGRLEAFMREPNKAESEITPVAGAQLQLKHASFSWPGARRLVLDEVSVAFPTGLTVVCGKVAAGKTALLQALLGELDMRGGELVRPTEMFGYCAQTPWLQSMSIRENILFSSPYNDSRYKRVIAACALTEDLAAFEHGDLSNIGENGVGLSGGQKARVALARALYSQANILLLDDPISALDQQTAETVVQRCFEASFLADRTTVLVTHRTDLCCGLAKQVVEISEGRARLLGPDTSFSSSPGSMQSSNAMTNADHAKDAERELAAVPEKFIEDEYRATGGVRARVYWVYIRAGKLRWWLVLACVLTLYRLSAVGRSWFLKQWGEAYNQPEELTISDPFERFPSPEANIRPWLIVFLLFAVFQAVMFFVSRCLMLIIIYIAGRQMFQDIMKSVSYATFRFYDVTPVGRLMNRLTSDIGTIDGNISQQFQDIAWLLIGWVTSIVVIGSVTPGFLVFSVLLTLGFVLIFLRFLPTSQSLRRLETVSLSPLMSNFGALSDGLATVRAFCAQHRFQDRVITVTDAFQKMDHFYWSLQAWLMYRFDILSASSTLLLTLLALYTGVSPGLTAFVLVAASRFVTSTHALCRQYGQLQMDFVSVERVVELLHVDQEPSGTVSPPAWWPSFNGDVVFENVTIRYAPHLEPALSSVSFRIKAGSKTAIIGRTGSGKSTLALALLATVLPESGRIFIDGIDISTVDTQALRSRVTFLAQEPLLFPGSLRQNLDPLKQHSDAECETVLFKILDQSRSHNTNTNTSHGDGRWSLSTQIDTAGRNLSQGQRQLIGLARAVLRKSPIIILDEATASIDLPTALRIQQVLAEEMEASTVITIAHRVEAVRRADWVVVLGEGSVRRVGSVAEVLGEGEG